MERQSSDDQLERKVRAHNDQVQKTAFRMAASHQVMHFHASLGISSNIIGGQFTFINDDEILYYVPSMIVIRNIQKNTNNFVEREGRLKNVTAFAATNKYGSSQWLIVAGQSSEMGQDRKASLSLIAMQEDKQKQWQIIDTKIRGKILQIQINKSKKMCACLIEQCQTGYPVIMIWKMGKNVLLVHQTFKTRQCFKFKLDPHNQRRVYTMAQNFLKLWEINAQQRHLKELSLITRECKNPQFIDWSWVGGGDCLILAAISASKMYLIVAGHIKKIIQIDKQLRAKKVNLMQKEIEKSLEQIYQMKQVFDYQLKQNDKEIKRQFSDESEDDLRLTCILPKCQWKHSDKSKAMIVLGSNGTVLFYQISRDLELSHYQSLEVCSQHQILALNSNRSQSLIGCISSHGLTKYLRFNLLKVSLMESEDSPASDIFGEGQHHKSILSLSCSTQKNLLASSSADRTVKVWSYGEEMESRSLLSAQFKDEPVCVTTHPLGIMVAISFKTEIRVFGILSNQFYLIKSLKHVEQCRQLMFTNHGNFLITNEYSAIKIYDSVSFKVVASFQLQQNKQWITQLGLAQDDSKLVVVLNSGATYLLPIQPGKTKERLSDFPDHIEHFGYRHIQYDSKVRNNPDQDLFVGSNAYKIFVVYRKKCRQLFAQIAVSDCVTESMCLARQLGLLIIGTNKGSVRLYPWPIDENVCFMEVISGKTGQVRYASPSFYQLSVHSLKIRALAVRDDNSFIVAGCDDGDIKIIALTDLDDRNIEKSKQQQIRNNEERRKLIALTSNLFLMRAADVQGKNQMIKKSEQDVFKAEQAINREKARRKRELEQVRDKFKKQHEHNTQIQNKLKENNFAEEEAEIKKLQKSIEELKERQTREAVCARLIYKEKKEYEINRNRQVQVQIQLRRQAHKKQLDELLCLHRKEIQGLRAQYRQKNEKIRIEFENLIKEASFKKIQELQTFTQEKEQTKFMKEEIEEMRKCNIAILKKEEEVAKEYEQRKAEDERVQVEFQTLFQKHNDLRLKNLRNQEEMVKLQHQLLQRLQVLDYKEQACKSVKQYQKNLENFKFILDDKVETMQGDKKQTLDSINQKQLELQHMFQELVNESSRNDRHDDQLMRLQAQISTAQNSLKKGQISLDVKLKKMRQLQDRLKQIMEAETNQAARVLLKQLIEEAEGRLPNRQQTGDVIMDQSIRHGSWMAKKLNLMKITSRKVRQIKQGNINIVLRQNRKLLEQCNLLRTQNHAYDVQIRKAEHSIEQLHQRQQHFKALRAQEAQIQRLKEKFIRNQQEITNQNEKLHNFKEHVEDCVGNVI